MPTVTPTASVDPRYSAASLAGFTCGILSFVVSGFIFLAIPLALIGLYTSKKGWRESKSSLAKKGYRLSGYGLIFTISIYLIAAVIAIIDFKTNIF